MTHPPLHPPGRVEFPSGDALLRGLFYEHPESTLRPVIVMAHGFSATITGMVADRYAEVLHAAGVNVLLFDHRGFGLSGGEPRLVLNRWLQMRGYHDALDFVAGLPSVDSSRMAIWGDSMSASVAIAVAAFDERVAALVAQVPACGREAPPPPSDSAFAALLDLHRNGAPAAGDAERIGPMAVVSHDQVMAPSLLTPVTAFRWFIDYGARPGTGWQNEATLELPATPVPFHAGLCAPYIRGASFWVIADDDEMPGADPPVARTVFDRAPQPKELLRIDGGHFGLLYHPSELFDRVSAAQAEFVVRRLC